jgi:putative copper export protein
MFLAIIWKHIVCLSLHVFVIQVSAMEQGKITKLFPNYLLQEFQSLSSGKIWKAEHDLLLLKGIIKYATFSHIQFVTIMFLKI